MSDTRCACMSTDAHDCWRLRYQRRMDDMEDRWTCEEIEAQGGPCECICHDADWDDDDA